MLSQRGLRYHSERTEDSGHGTSSDYEGGHKRKGSAEERNIVTGVGGRHGVWIVHDAAASTGEVDGTGI